MILMLVTGAAAQTNTGEIAGVVKDTSGGVLPGATVTATHPASGTVVERVTDGEGRFFLPALRIGQWEVTATLARLRAPDAERIVLEIGRTLNSRVHARRRGPRRAGHRRGDRAAPADDHRGDQRRHREPRGRAAAAERAQLPGARAAQRRRRHCRRAARAARRCSRLARCPNVGGQRSGHNIYLLDGTKVTDELFNNLVINPSVDSIEEFKIQKSMYPAEFGGKASALINVATKAGSNAFRGSLFEFHRNDAFDSPNYFQPAGQSDSAACARTSSAARSAGRSCRTGRSSSAATKARG